MKPYGTLGKDFLTKLDPDACELCEAHEQAAEKLKTIPCPNCGQDLHDQLMRGGCVNRIIGQDNGLDVAEQRFALLPTTECEKCGQYIALWPEAIIWNANHDVYYSGRQFSPLRDEDLGDKLRRSQLDFLIKNFLERRAAGEPLTADQLRYWIEGEVSSVLNLYLTEKGYKR